MDMKLLAIARDDAGSFLSAMLQGIRPEIREVCRFLVAIIAKDAHSSWNLSGVIMGMARGRRRRRLKETLGPDS